MLLLVLKIAVVVAVAGVLLFVVEYTRLTRGRVWKDPIGRTIIVKDVFLLGELMPLLLASFLHFSTFGNRVGSWVLVGFIGLMGVAMFWRTWVFERENKNKGKL